MSVEVSSDITSRIMRDEDGDDEYETQVALLSAGTTDLMPGDKIEFADLTITFSVATGKHAYYVIKYNGNYYSDQNTPISAASGVLQVDDGDTVSFAGAADIIVPENTGNASQGQTYTNANIAVLGAVEVRMVQTENISQTEAYTFLITDANWAA